VAEKKIISARPPRPLLIFDADCGFCRRWIRRWHFLTGRLVDYAPSQEVGARFPEIPPDDFTNAVQLVEPDGRWTQGAEAVFRTLAVRPSLRWIRWAYEHVPAVAFVTETAYHWVARHRMTASKFTHVMWGQDLSPSSYVLTRDLFLRALALVYLIAFASLRPQIIGLLGEKGILPARLLMEHARAQIPGQYHLLPTLAWWRVDDAFLRLLCSGGIALSLAAFFQIAPPLTFFLLWLFYLSIVSIGGDFLSFQWDMLLLETGFLAIFFAPMQLISTWRRTADPPSRIILWMLRWLLFRLMIQSAIVKWTSGDLRWHHLTALQVYYETMPLPNVMSWLMHQLPGWFHRLSALVVFAVEGLVPFLIFFPRRPRVWACGALAAFQIVIFITGNYGFFNVLTLALCLLLLDDQTLNRWFTSFPAVAGGESITKGKTPHGSPTESFGDDGYTASAFRFALKFVRGVVACLVLALSSLQFALLLGFPPAHWLYNSVAGAEPFRSVNNYGLFAVMTTSRPEITVEGSRDGKNWLAYEFRYKIQDLDGRPKQVAPYMPRLDWQMWFAALSEYRQNPWFINFCVRLLQGSPDVLSLLKTNPFPDQPPKYLRAMLYDYRFTDIPGHRKTGAWWRRVPLGDYCPPIGIRQ